MKRIALVVAALMLLALCALTACEVTAPVDPAYTTPSGGQHTTQTPTTEKPTTSHDCDSQGHIWEATSSKLATCTEAGKIDYVCSYCGQTKSSTVKAIGHVMDAGVYTPGTCQTAGSTLYTCMLCGTTQIKVDGAKADHHFVEGECTVCHTHTTKTEIKADPGRDTVVMADYYNTGFGSVDYRDAVVIKASTLPAGDTTLQPGVVINVSVADDGSRNYKVTADYSKMSPEVKAAKMVTVANYDFDGKVTVKVTGTGTYTYTENYGEEIDDGYFSDPTGGRFTLKLENCNLMQGITGMSDRSGAGNSCYYFDHCSFKTTGMTSNCVFNWCKVGGHEQEDSDGFRPVQNVFIYNTYVYEMGAVGYGSAKDELHVDATQIYGYNPSPAGANAVEQPAVLKTVGGKLVATFPEGVSYYPAKNVHHYNYHCEMPSIYYTGSFSYTNSCLMISMDYTDGFNMSFVHCYINGTGCPLMCNDHPHKGGGTLYGANQGNYNIYDILYRDIYHGCGSTYDEYNSNGSIRSFNIWNESNYKTNPDYASDKTHTEEEKKALYMSDVTMENWNETIGTLLVGSVWEEDGKAYFNVFNDTYTEREITIVTANGNKYSYGISRHLRKQDYPEDLAARELPLDVAMSIPETADWYVCFDSTEGKFTQIRCYNPGDAKIELDVMQLASDWTPAQYAYRFVREGAGVWKAVNVSGVYAIGFNRYLNKDFVDTNIRYTLTSDGVLTISGEGKMPDLSTSIIQKSAYYEHASMVTKIVVEPGVTSISANAFKGLNKVKTVVLPVGLTAIKSSAFAGCASLESIVFPETLTNIDTDAFKGCVSLKSVTIPQNVTYLQEGAFSYCTGLKDVTIASPVLGEIASNAFLHCKSLASVTFVAGVKTVGIDAFSGCNALASVTFGGDDAAWKAINFGGNETLVNATRTLTSAEAVVNAAAASVKAGTRQAVTYSTNKFKAGTQEDLKTCRTAKYVGGQGSALRDLSFFVTRREERGHKLAGVFAPPMCPTWAYNGEPIDLGFRCNSDGEVSIKWMKGSVIVGFNDDAPVEPGIYTMVLTVEGTEAFEPLEIHQMFYILVVPEE